MKLEIALHDSDQVDATFDGLTIVTHQDGSAPGPFDLFLASMGTCMGYYVSRFCRERAIAVDGLRLTQVADKDPDSHLVERITFEIHLPADFPAKYRQAVVRAAGQCTVKRHLTHPPALEIRALDGA